VAVVATVAAIVMAVAVAATAAVTLAVDAVALAAVVVAVTAVAVAVASAVVAMAAVATVAATKPARTALLAGATGLVGRELLQLLLADDAYNAVHCVGRRAPAVAHPKLTAHVVADLTNPALLAAVPACDDVYIALGTTIKVAGSPEAFKAVDYDAVMAIVHANTAQAAIKNIANEIHLGVVSAMGADAQSGVFYSRTKGEMEAAITDAGYASVSIARPSMLAGDRASLQQAARLGEHIGLVLMQALRFAIPANYQAIEATQVARALHRMVREGEHGTRIALSGELQTLGA
jgi:uncharacterized protein YbjT (DUF2867 family)